MATKKKEPEKKRPTEDEIIFNQRELVFDTIKDLVHDFLYHDRKEDKELSSETLWKLLTDKEVTTADIINIFARELRREIY